MSMHAVHTACINFLRNRRNLDFAIFDVLLGLAGASSMSDFLTPSSKHAEGGGGEEVAEQQGVGQQLLIAGLLSFLETAVQVAKEQITVSHPTGIEYTFFRRLSAPPCVDAPPTMLAKAHASCLSNLQNAGTSATL